MWRNKLIIDLLFYNKSKISAVCTNLFIENAQNVPEKWDLISENLRLNGIKEAKIMQIKGMLDVCEKQGYRELKKLLSPKTIAKNYQFLEQIDVKKDYMDTVFRHVEKVIEANTPFQFERK